MSDRREQFQVGDDPAVAVSLPSGSVRVSGGDPGQVTVEIRGPEADHFDIRHAGGEVTVGLEDRYGSRWHAHDVLVTVPAGASLEARVASAGLSVDTDLSRLEVHSGSGDVVAAGVRGDVVVKSASGDVRIGSAGGHARLSSASGDLQIGSCGGTVATNSAGGDVRLGSVAGALSVRSASGDVAVEHYAGDDLTCATVSGDVSIAVVGGRTLDLDLFSLAGDIDNEFDLASQGEATGAAGGEVGRVSVRSTAGDIVLRRAATA